MKSEQFRVICGFSGIDLYESGYARSPFVLYLAERFTVESIKEELVSQIDVETEIDEEGCLNTWFMPWFDGESVIDFGQIKVWDYFNKPNNFTIGGSFENLMPVLSRSFRDRNGSPVSRLGVISDTRNDDETRNERSRWAAKAIAFCYIAGIAESFVTGELSALPLTCSERFSSHLVGVVYGNIFEHMSYAESMTPLDGESLKFFEPYALPPVSAYPNRTVMEALAKLNDGFPYDKNENLRKLWQQLEIVFDWFSNAWTCNPTTNHFTRYISMMVAFEALTREENDLSKVFQLAKKADKIAGWTESSLPQKYEHRHRERLSMVSEPVKWILEYGAMRNKIAHGGYTPCGLWEFITPIGTLNPKTAMTIIVNELVVKLLIKTELLEGFAADFVQARLNDMRKRLGWTSKTALSPSPSLTRLRDNPDPRQWRYWAESFKKAAEGAEKSEIVWSGTPEEFFEKLKGGK